MKEKSWDEKFQLISGRQKNSRMIIDKKRTEEAES